MSIDKNRELYNNILNSIDTQQNFYALSTCDITVTTGTASLNEAEPTASEIIIGNFAVSGTGTFDQSGVPSFVSMRQTTTSVNFNVYEFFIASGTTVDYDTVATGQNSQVFTISGSTYLNCSGELAFTLNDLNDEPVDVVFINANKPACTGSFTNLGFFQVEDLDITDEFRTIYFEIVPDSTSDSFSLDKSQVVGSGRADLFLNTTGVTISSTATVNVAITDSGSYNVTGTVSVNVDRGFVPNINTYNYVSGLPAGMFASTGNPIVIGHKIPFLSSGINEAYGCSDNCTMVGSENIESTSASYIFYYPTGVGDSIEVSIQRSIGGFGSGVSFGGVGTIRFTGADVPSSRCCGLDDATISTDNILLGRHDPFLTGVGQTIPFSGGVNNVENSYFEPLGTGLFVLAPQGTGGAGSTSNDDYLYTYQYGSSSYSGIKHPTETGLVEVVGAHARSSYNNYIVCRFASDPTRIYRYNTITQLWNPQQPFGGAGVVNRISRLDYNNGKYLVIGTGVGEFKIYNAVTDTISSTLTDNSTGGTARVLPAKISVIPTLRQEDCYWDAQNSEDMVVHSGLYHILATDHHYSGTSDYPLLLDLNTNSLNSGEFTLSGNVSSGTTYLHSYLNYRADAITVADKLVVSLCSTGNDASQLVVRDNSSLSINSVYAAQGRRRISKLVNDQVLWASSQTTGISAIIDPYNMLSYPFFDNITGNIEVTYSCPAEFRTLLLEEGGEKAYALRDLDRLYDTHSFTGSLNMGTYHDIIVFDRLSGTVNQSHNFYLMPSTIASSTFPENKLIALSTTTVSATGVEWDNGSGVFDIDETVVAGNATQTTTGLIPIGGFTFTNDDEFLGYNQLFIETGSVISGTFSTVISGSSGTLFLNSGVACDHETTPFYATSMTGNDPYVGTICPECIVNAPFTVNVLNVPEIPTGVTFTPSGSGGYNQNSSTASDVLVALFNVLDPDTSGNGNNEVVLAGADSSFFNITFNTGTQEGNIYLNSGTVLNKFVKRDYNISIIAGQSGETPSVTGEWLFFATDNPPVSATLSVSGVDVREDQIIPSTGFKVSELTVQDNDTSSDNFAMMLGDDADLFTLDYNPIAGTGAIAIAVGVLLDFETKPILTGLVGVGNIFGQYSASAQVLVNLLDVVEATGITCTPDLLSLNEDYSVSTGTFISSLIFTDPLLQNDISVYDLRYAGSGFRSALDRFYIEDNETRTPEIYLQPGASLDYETEPRIDLVVSGRPPFLQPGSPYDLGGLITITINDANDPPAVSFDPASLLIADDTPTQAGRFKIADIKVKDEDQNTVTYALTGSDASIFSIDVATGITADRTQFIKTAELFVNSGATLGSSDLNALVVATDASGAFVTGDFVLGISSTGVDCRYSFSSTVTDLVCGNEDNGRIRIDVAYTGGEGEVDETFACQNEYPLRVDWLNLPTDAGTGLNGTRINNLPTGSYSGYLFGGTLPLSELNFSVVTTSTLQLLQTVKQQNPCEGSGTIDITWSGGVPPYIVSMGSFSSGALDGITSLSLPVAANVSGRPTVQDSNGCLVTGAVTEFSFITEQFEFSGQSPPLIRDAALESFNFNVSFGSGPYQIELYSTTTGEQGNVVSTFARYDTTILQKVEQPGATYIDDSGVSQAVINNTNPMTYYYDLGGKIFPGSYIMEFINNDDCSFVTERFEANNVPALTVSATSYSDQPTELGFQAISQPLLDTLFIPYRFLVGDADLLSFVSGLTENTEIKIEVDGQVYVRSVLFGAINCDTYSTLNVKFFGIDSLDWYYTLPFFQAFDITDSDIDILNKESFLILPGGRKIRLETSLNNDVNTIKLLKGSILTTDLNTSQYKQGVDIGLFTYNNSVGDFTRLQDVKTQVIDVDILTNKYVPGSITRIDFLNTPKLSANLRSDQIEDVSFNCQESMGLLLEARKFLMILNEKAFLTNMYVKSTDFLHHSAAMFFLVNGGYAPYSYSYKYYDRNTRCLSDVLQNNLPVNTADLANVPAGVYIVKIRDLNGGKIDRINNESYDIVHINTLDFILNDLDTTPEAIDYEYGDILYNLVDLRFESSPPDGGLPGVIRPPEESVPPAAPPPVITTSDILLSPNTSYRNSLTIQTDPGKISFLVTGPMGYKRKFNDRVVLSQMPPGVYNIEPDAEQLNDLYYYSQNRSINISQTTNVLVSFTFESYRDTVLIDDSSCSIDTNYFTINYDFVATGNPISKLNNNSNYVSSGDNISELSNGTGFIISNSSSAGAGSSVTNIVMISSGEYSGITMDANTIYYITG